MRAHFEDARKDQRGLQMRVSHSLTYANIVATLALFVSLGGASYAAITLPAGSVGPRQIRASAVGLSALSFPLGTVGTTNDKPEDLTKGACNSPLMIGVAAPPCTPSPHGGPTPGREVHLSLPSSGRLLLTAIVGLNNQGTQNTIARITLELNVDGNPVNESTVDSAGGQIVQVPIQALVNVSSGAHNAGLAVRAEYKSSGPGDVLVTTTSLVATSLPRG